MCLYLITHESKAGALGNIMKWVGNEIFELALDEVEGAALDAARDMSPVMEHRPSRWMI